MEKQEYELWKKLDIYGYKVMVSIFQNTPKNVKKYHEKGKNDIVIRELKRLEETCEKYRRRIEIINVNDYDIRLFPIDLINSLKTRVYKSLLELPNILKADINTGVFVISIEYSAKETVFMLELGKNINEQPGYREYRKLTKEEDRIINW